MSCPPRWRWKRDFDPQHEKGVVGNVLDYMSNQPGKGGKGPRNAKFGLRKRRWGVKGQLKKSALHVDLQQCSGEGSRALASKVVIGQATAVKRHGPSRWDVRNMVSWGDSPKRWGGNSGGTRKKGDVR